MLYLAEYKRLFIEKKALKTNNSDNTTDEIIEESRNTPVCS